jgi:hypothetical protein
MADKTWTASVLDCSFSAKIIKIKTMFRSPLYVIRDGRFVRLEPRKKSSKFSVRGLVFWLLLGILVGVLI